ncbi:MAG: DUF1501 domain-containing protein [Planctomycetes bacterium]|nr:DUF1501 domain-containing protein [Planctomycetota bacterium]
MAKIHPTGEQHGCVDCDGKSGLNRRNFIKTGVFSFLGLSMLDLLKITAHAGENDAKCDAVILVWLAGGPSHIDTFDPKPGEETNGPYKPLTTSANGIQICEHLPIVARNMKHASLIRSLTNKEGSHERATYHMHTGYKPLGSIRHPSLGSLVINHKPKRNEEIPAFVSIGRTAFGAGFLGTKVAPFVIGDPNNPTRNLVYPGGVDHERYSRRIDLLQRVDAEFSQQERDEAVKDYGTYYRDAVRMMHSNSVEAFDLGHEKEMYKIGYGENNFGRGLLMARRLVEKGVRFVEVTLGGWDTHNDGFNAVQNNCNTLDPALGTLIEDLNARGLLKRTMVICTGEFGRTPKINSRSGRDHYPRVWSALVAGGGLKAGYAYGASDKKGEAVKDNPVRPGDLHATMFHLLGVDPAHENYTEQGRPIRVVDEGKPIEGLIA